jgi:hypothetical protein
MIEDMARVMRDIAMETFTRVSLQEERQMVLEFITGRMGKFIKATGLMVKRTDKALGQVR